MLKKSFATVVVAALACGGGDAPKQLVEPRVLVSHLVVRKRLLWKNSHVGLIRQLAINDPHTPRSIYVVGYERSCEVSLEGQTIRCAATAAELGAPVGVEKNGNLPPLNEGSITADFDGDGSPDRLTSPAENQFKITSANGRVLGQTTIKGDYWFEPVVTQSTPHHVLISTDNGLLVFDNQLQKQTVLPTPGVAAPLHIQAGEPLGSFERTNFVSLFSGRGGWHRTLLFIHSAQGEVLYNEILDDDYHSILPLPSSGNRKLFLVSGRGTVWLYSA